MQNDNYKKYRREPIRLQGYDYGANGAYFITILAANRINYFGTINYAKVDEHDFNNCDEDAINASQQLVELSPIGKITHQYWLDIPAHFPFVSLDEFVVMPNHIHGVLIFDKTVTPQDFVELQMQASKPNSPEYFSGLSGKKSKFGPQSKNLGSVMRGYKAGVKSYATITGIEFCWHSRFHDRIIRDEAEMQRIKRYIFENPWKWDEDEDNLNRVKAG